LLDKEAKRCNRTMSIGDDDSLMWCQLPMGHDGPHQESYDSERFGKVTTTFENGTTPVRMNRLKHMVPAGRICWFKDGRTCPFLALTDHPEGEASEFACYLSADTNPIWPSEFHKGCH
jgi:hypothetical protein